MSSAIIYNGHDKSFNSILIENNLKTIHKKNLEFLAIKIHKFQNGLPPPIKNDIFFSRQTFIISESFRNFPPQLNTL